MFIKLLPSVLFTFGDLKGYARENGYQKRRLNLNFYRLYYLYLWRFKWILWREMDVKKED